MLDSLARLIMGAWAPAGARGRLSVLIYHRVLPAPDPLLPDEPSAFEFERTMRWLKRAFNVIDLAEAVDGLRSGRLPPRALSITFDDGYANNESIAAPILARLGLPATFFVATGFLDGGRMFNDSVVEAVRACAAPELDLESLGLGRYPAADAQQKIHSIGQILAAIKHRPPEQRAELAERIAQIAGATLPADLMMTSAQAANLARMGFALGGHTVNHPILAMLPAVEAQAEIMRGKQHLEDLASQRIALFAYPNGRPSLDYTRATVDLVRSAGFDGAVCTSPGAARVGSDIFQIPRFTPWDKGRARFTARMWSNLSRTVPAYATA